MLAHIARRLLWSCAVVLGVITITFLLSRVIPADPAQLAAGLDAGPEQVAKIRTMMGLDRPLPVQFLFYLRAIAHGDLGQSIQTRAPVSTDLRAFFPATLELSLWVMLLYVVLGIPLGVVAATRAGSPFDVLTRGLAVGGAAIPVFWAGIMLQILFYRVLGWLPAVGRIDSFVTPPPAVTGSLVLDSLLAGNFAALWSAAAHLVLPVLTLVIGRLPVALRLTRVAMVDVLSRDYVRTARAKGLPERRVLTRHALRNALLPVITMVGLQFGWLLGGTVVTETVFSWPGIGQYMVKSILTLDFNAIMGGTILLSVCFVLINLGVDILYSLLDPRIAW
ncbi:MAG: ABC transporter permease [Armatimonadetes bacterium]|nr:ABC transporter permease [Armatimonadota bacterium]